MPVAGTKPGDNNRATVHSAEIFMHVWQLHTSANGDRREAAQEVELTASHTPDATHLDPSCPACHHLRSRLQVIAETVAQRVAASTNGVIFDVYADSTRIVCSPRDGQRPCVSVSIYIRYRLEESGPNGPGAATSRVKEGLAVMGVRER